MSVHTHSALTTGNVNKFNLILIMCLQMLKLTKINKGCRGIVN